MNFDIRVYLFYLFLICLPFWFYGKFKKINTPGFEWIGVITLFSGCFSVITLFIISPARIPSESMLPNLKPNSFVWLLPSAYSIKMPGLEFSIVKTGQPKRGDVVAFYHGTDSSMLLAKRVIALPGETLILTKNEILVDDLVLPARPLNTSKEGIELWVQEIEGAEFIYGYGEGATKAKREHIKVVVPEGKYFVLGDNRDNSVDSRSFGFISFEKLAGKIIE